MSGWFTRASSVFRRPAPEIEQPFEIACECGLVHKGIRRARFQRIICRDCGTSKFVLPRDVYPPPREIAKPRPAPVPLQVVKPSEVQRIPDDEEYSNGDGQVAIAEPPKKAAKPARAKAKPKKPEEPRLLTVPSDGRFWTPFRFVTLGIAISLLLLAGVLVRKYRRDSAIDVLRTAGEKAEAAVQERDWATAAERFGAAVKAVTILDRTDIAAKRLRQGFAETSAILDLHSGTLGDVLRDAEKHLDDKPEAWKQQFDIQHRGKWFVFETPLTTDEDDPNVWSFQYPQPVGEEGRIGVVHADLKVFQAIQSLEPGTPVIFAAPIESCELSGGRRQWNVRLNPDAGFLWANLETYRGLGFEFNEWHPEDDTKAALERQSKWIGVQADAEK
jgi:hypothetical protein